MKRLILHADEPLSVVNRHIFGHFSEHLGRCIYDGYWPGNELDVPSVRGIRTDIVEALKKIRSPNIRWPGGCFADDYHWKDGIGPLEQRPSMVNTHWGGVVENNHFGTHEFLDLCEQVGAEPYICGNVGSGTVKEMRDWVEYITGPTGSPMGKLRSQNGREAPWKLPYFGVGNENWGCGGNMRPGYYADLYKRFAGYVRKVGGSDVYRVACGSHDAYYEWTEVLMRDAASHFEGLSYHYYTALPRGGVSRSATDFDEAAWFATMKRACEIEPTIDRHISIMDSYDPDRRVGLIVDEWGTWHDVEPGTNPGFLYQQNTIRDALVAAHHLNQFGLRANRIPMANIAQTVNVLQAVILTDGAQLIKTPTYHVFDMYKEHQDGTLVQMSLDRGEYVYEGNSVPALSALCTRNADGVLHLTIANMDPNSANDIELSLRGPGGDLSVSGRILTADAMQTCNTVETPEAVVPDVYTKARISGPDILHLDVPARSVIALSIHGKDPR